MKKIVSLAVAGVAMLALNGCNLQNVPGTASVFIENLADGYKISGTDTSSNEAVDLCFYGSKAYEYGRGTVLFTGRFKTDVNGDGEIDFYDDDGGSYTLEVNGEVTEGDKYYFRGIEPHNIKVETITQTFTDCKNLGMFARTPSADVK